jgi:hypothetical protein
MIVGSQRKRAANALASVLAQAEIERAEVILIDVALDRFPPLTGSDHPQVRTIHMGKELHFGAMRAYAARIARGELVAYLEEHALALPGWLKETLAAFARADWAAVAGVVVPANPAPGWSMLINMVTFSNFADGVCSGETGVLPGHNTTYRRHLLLSFGSDLEELMLLEPAVQGRLRELGYKLYLENRIKWIHLNEHQAVQLFSDYFSWNVLFGRHRVAGRPLAYRLLRVITTPLILPVRIGKSLLRVRRRAGKNWPAYVRLVPLLLVIHLADTLGLGIGYMGGWKGFEKALTIAEIEVEREPPPCIFDMGHTKNETQLLRLAGG